MTSIPSVQIDLVVLEAVDSMNDQSAAVTGPPDVGTYALEQRGPEAFPSVVDRNAGFEPSHNKA